MGSGSHFGSKLMRVRPTPWSCDLFHAMLPNLYDAAGIEQGAFSQNELSFSPKIAFQIHIPLLTVYTNCSAWHLDVTSNASRVCISAWWHCTNYNHSVLLCHRKINHNASCIHVCGSWKPGLEWCCPNFLTILLKCRPSGPWMQHSSISDTVYVLAWVHW
jgi:hypothetical protein